MKTAELIEILEQAAADCQIDVRYETMTMVSPTGGGGLCKVKGRWWLIIDKKATPNDRASMLVDALAAVDTAALSLPPRVRDMIDKRRPAADAALNPTAT